MTVKFKYGEKEYLYNSDSCWIEKPIIADKLADKVCPVQSDLSEKSNFLDTLSQEDLICILKAILHSYSYGVSDGKCAKAAEIRRSLNID